MENILQLTQPNDQPFYVQILQAFAFADQILPGSGTFDLSVGPFSLSEV